MPWTYADASSGGRGDGAGGCAIADASKVRIGARSDMGRGASSLSSHCGGPRMHCKASSTAPRDDSKSAMSSRGASAKNAGPGTLVDRGLPGRSSTCGSYSASSGVTSQGFLGLLGDIRGDKVSERFTASNKMRTASPVSWFIGMMVWKKVSSRAARGGRRFLAQELAPIDVGLQRAVQPAQRPTKRSAPTAMPATLPPASVLLSAAAEGTGTSPSGTPVPDPLADDPAPPTAADRTGGVRSGLGEGEPAPPLPPKLEATA